MEKRSDEELLAEHVKGVPGAFDELIARYAGELFGFLSRFVGNRAAADDLVQEAFLQVHMSAASFDASRSFKPWLYTIASNKARDYLRSRSRRQEQSLDAPLAGSDAAVASTVAGEAPSADEQPSADERKQKVRELIARMPEHLRAILLLGYFQQLPYAEIAEVLDIPVGTVKSRLHAAVGHFARLWAAENRTSLPARG